jgi:hypothetical protein
MAWWADRPKDRWNRQTDKEMGRWTYKTIALVDRQTEEWRKDKPMNRLTDEPVLMDRQAKGFGRKINGWKAGI